MNVWNCQLPGISRFDQGCRNRIRVNITKPLSEKNMASSIFGNGIRSRNEIKNMAMLSRDGS